MSTAHILFMFALLAVASFAIVIWYRSKKKIKEAEEVTNKIDLQGYLIRDEEATDEDEEQEHISVLESYRNHTFRVGHIDDTNSMPFLATDDLPDAMRWPTELIELFNREYPFKAQLMTRKQIQGVLDTFGITIDMTDITYQMPKTEDLTDAGDDVIMELFVRASEQHDYSHDYTDAINESMEMVVRYNYNNEIIPKKAKNVDLYKSYHRKFKNNNIPSAAEFLAWYDEATDELLKMEDYSDDPETVLAIEDTN